MQMQMIDPTVLKFNNIRNMERIKSSPEFQELVDSVREEGVLAPYISPNVVDIPDQYLDPEGYWAGFKTDMRTMVGNVPAGAQARIVDWHIHRLTGDQNEVE